MILTSQGSLLKTGFLVWAALVKIMEPCVSNDHQAQLHHHARIYSHDYRGDDYCFALSMIAILCSIILILGVFLVIISLCEDYSVHHMALNCVLNLDDCAAAPLLLQLVPPSCSPNPSVLHLDI